jgi:hypothetical protein
LLTLHSLDVQFRLLRTDATSGLQQGIQAVAEDFQSDDFYKTEREPPD